MNWAAFKLADRQVLWRTAQDGFSVAQSCPSLYDPMGCSMPGFPALHYLPEFTQTCVHWVCVMPSNHLSLCRPLLLLPSVFPSIKVRDFYRPKWAGTRKLYWVFAGWLEQGFYMKWKSILEQVSNLCWAGKHWFVDLGLLFLGEPSIETQLSFGLLTWGLRWVAPAWASSVYSNIIKLGKNWSTSYKYRKKSSSNKWLSRFIWCVLYSHSC